MRIYLAQSTSQETCHKGGIALLGQWSRRYRVWIDLLYSILFYGCNDELN